MSKRLWQTELVLLFCGVQFLCVLLGQVAALLLHRLGLQGFRGEEGFGVILLVTLSFQGATWILIPVFLRLHHRRWRRVFGFPAVNVAGSLALALAVLLMVLPVALVLQRLSAWVMEQFHWLPAEQTAVKLFLTTPWWPTGIYLAVFAVVLAPVAEEFIFRGVLFPFIKQLGHPKTAWLGVNLFFALIHMDAAALVPLFVLALALTWLYEYTESLFAPIVVHMLFNATNLAVLILAEHFQSVQ